MGEPSPLLPDEVCDELGLLPEQLATALETPLDTLWDDYSAHKLQDRLADLVNTWRDCVLRDFGGRHGHLWAALHEPVIYPPSSTSFALLHRLHPVLRRLSLGLPAGTSREVTPMIWLTSPFRDIPIPKQPVCVIVDLRPDHPLRDVLEVVHRSLPDRDAEFHRSIAVLGPDDEEPELEDDLRRLGSLYIPWSRETSLLRELHYRQIQSPLVQPLPAKEQRLDAYVKPRAMVSDATFKEHWGAEFVVDDAEDEEPVVPEPSTFNWTSSRGDDEV